MDRWGVSFDAFSSWRSFGCRVFTVPDVIQMFFFFFWRLIGWIQESCLVQRAKRKRRSQCRRQFLEWRWGLPQEQPGTPSGSPKTLALPGTPSKGPGGRTTLSGFAGMAVGFLQFFTTVWCILRAATCFLLEKRTSGWWFHFKSYSSCFVSNVLLSFFSPNPWFAHSPSIPIQTILHDARCQRMKTLLICSLAQAATDYCWENTAWQVFFMSFFSCLGFAPSFWRCNLLQLRLSMLTCCSDIWRSTLPKCGGWKLHPCTSCTSLSAAAASSTL